MDINAVVIIPATCKSSMALARAIDSVLNQTHPTRCYLVTDGPEFQEDVDWLLSHMFADWGDSEFERFSHCELPINVGAKGFYGHRIYAAFSHLVNEDYVLFLDEDNWFEPNHVESMIETIGAGYWAYSLRNIVDKKGEFVCRDNCESLGMWSVWNRSEINHIDTSCFCIRQPVLTKLASAWHGGYAQDRVFYNTLKHYFNPYGCTGKYTVNYSLDGNPGSVSKEFFDMGNKFMNEKYNGVFPWNKTI